MKYAREVLDGKWGQDWALGYALIVHSSQGLTVADLKKVWIIDDFLQWSNLAYLAVSRVEYLSQLERVVCPPEKGSVGARTLTEQQLRKVIQRKLVAYKRQDQAKGLRFSLKVNHILALKEAQIAVPRATSSSYGLTSQRTPSSSVSTGSTTQSTSTITSG